MILIVLAIFLIIILSVVASTLYVVRQQTYRTFWEIPNNIW